jgi:SAM-dependent methyltransferase
MKPVIEIPSRNYLLYLLLPHAVKMRFLSAPSAQKLTEINREVNEVIYSGDNAINYDQIHRYGEAEQHDYPLRELVGDLWAQEGYGRAVDLGAGSGYVTALIARHAQSVVAVELVPDMQRMIRDRCAREGLDHVKVVGASVFELDDRVGDGFDSAFVIQSLHHLHRRQEMFKILRRLLRPGGRLFMLEPHHNVRRALRLFRWWLVTYRRPAYWRQERNWATHDFVTRPEIRTLCRRAGFEAVRISGYWMPGFGRLLPDRMRRFRAETVVGRIPGLRHLAGVFAIEARRSR